jgi:hypothetical protein
VSETQKTSESPHSDVGASANRMICATRISQNRVQIIATDGLDLFDSLSRLANLAGEVNDLHEVIHSEFDEGGETIHAFGVVQDVTDRVVVNDGSMFEPAMASEIGSRIAPLEGVLDNLNETIGPVSETNRKRLLLQCGYRRADELRRRDYQELSAADHRETLRFRSDPDSRARSESWP